MKTAYRIIAGFLVVVFLLGFVPVGASPKASAAEIEGAYINGLDYSNLVETEQSSDRISLQYMFSSSLAVSFVDIVIAVYDGSITSAWWDGYMLSWSPITSVISDGHVLNYYRVYGDLEIGFNLPVNQLVYFTVRGSFLDISDVSVLQMRFINHDVLHRSGATTAELWYDQVEYKKMQEIDYVGWIISGYGLGTNEYSWYTKVAESEWKKADYIQLSYYFTVKDIRAISAYIGDTPVPVTVENLFSISTADNYGFSFVVTVDLRGVHDLSGTLEVGIDGTVADYAGSVMSWYQMFNTFLIVTEPENPLWAGLKQAVLVFQYLLTSIDSHLASIDNILLSNLARFLSVTFPDMADDVEGLFDTLTSIDNFITTKVDGFIASVGDFLSSFWENLTTVCGECLLIIARITQDQTDQLLGDGSEADAFGEEVAEQKKVFDSANDTLQSIQKPSIESFSSEADDILNPVGMSALAAPMQSILGNGLVVKILILAATLAMIGYLFFGKR